MESVKEKAITTRKFIFYYVIPLFAAALLLVLFSYFNDLRMKNAEDAIVDLGEELTQKQADVQSYSQKYEGMLLTLQELQKQYDTQKEKNKAFDAELTQKSEALSNANDTITALEQELALSAQKLEAYENMWALEQSFRGEAPEACRRLCAQMRDSGQLALLTAAQSESFLEVEKSVTVPVA